MRIHTILFVSFAFASTACATAQTAARAPEPASAETHSATAKLPTGDIHDFDTLTGDFTLKNRRLKARGVGSQEWEEFPAECHTRQYLGGMVNVDEITFPTKGWAGVTVRTFNPETRQWSIYWVSSRRGVMDSPQVGGFDGNRGVFYGEDVDDGRPVKVRYTWIKNSADTAHWEQAFSYDGGKTWETNWMNDLVRMRR